MSTAEFVLQQEVLFVLLKWNFLLVLDKFFLDLMVSLLVQMV